MPKENLEETAYKKIIKLILEHHFKPGDFLLETEITELLNMKSRTPVRHALGQLVAKGFLEKKKKKGCFIPSASPEDARHVFFARESIEYCTAASAARHATDKDIKELQSIIEKEAQTGISGNKIAYSSINEKLHYSIARISKNRYLEQYSRHVFWRSSFYIFFFGNYYVQKDYKKYMLSPPQHEKIVQAIAERNSEKAGELMKQHVRFTFEKIFLNV